MKNICILIKNFEGIKYKEKHEPTTLIDLKTASQLANNRYKDKLNRLSVDIGKNLQQKHILLFHY